MPTDLTKARQLFGTFSKIGAFTFGGGYAMIPLIQREVTERRRWLEDRDILDIVAIAESTPGPIAINTATFVGYQVCGTPGAFCATLGVVLPSFLIILLIARVFTRFAKSAPVQGVLNGLRPMVVGLIGAAALSVGRTAFALPAVTWQGLLSSDILWIIPIFILAAFLLWKRKWHPIAVILLAAALGIGAGFAREALPPG